MGVVSSSSGCIGFTGTLKRAHGISAGGVVFSESLHSHKKLCILGPNGGVLSFKPFKLFLLFAYLGCKNSDLSREFLYITETYHVA